MLAQARLGMLDAGTEKHMCDALRHWGLGLGLGLGGPFTRP